MRIAHVAPLAESVPPKLYGGTERVVAWLVDELVELGHDVTLFGDEIRARARDWCLFGLAHFALAALPLILSPHRLFLWKRLPNTQTSST